MRKFLISLLLLFIAMGTVFFFGYIPFRLNQGNYGVVYTKTNGWNHPVLVPGEFRWFWQGIFPTNLTLFQVNPARQEVPLKITGTLPSGATYSSYSETIEDFTYSVAATVSYSINPQVLPGLMEKMSVNETPLNTAESFSLSQTYKDIESKIKSISEISLSNIVQKGGSYLTGSEFSTDLEMQIKKDIPELEEIEIIVKTFFFPDIELYKTVQKNYIDYLNRNNELTLAAMQSASSAKAREISRIEVLKEYGALLKEYPVLLDYYSRDSTTGPLILLPDAGN